jgi:hypothetical protein
MHTGMDKMGHTSQRFQAGDHRLLNYFELVISAWNHANNSVHYSPVKQEFNRPIINGNRELYAALDFQGE